MTEAEITAMLSANDLRLKPEELPAFAALIRDMEAAAEIARRPLGYADEPCNMLRLAKPGA